jgi:hypothetical protein
MTFTQAAKREVKIDFDIRLPSLRPGTVTKTMITSLLAIGILSLKKGYLIHNQTTNYSIQI